MATARAVGFVTAKQIPPDTIDSVISFCPGGQSAVAGNWFSSITHAGAAGFNNDRTGYFLIVDNDTTIPVEIQAKVWCVQTGTAVAARRPDRRSTRRQVARLVRKTRAAKEQVGQATGS